jgi:hypothetical protein
MITKAIVKPGLRNQCSQWKNSPAPALQEEQVLVALVEEFIAP